MNNLPFSKGSARVPLACWVVGGLLAALVLIALLARPTENVSAVPEILPGDTQGREMRFRDFLKVVQAGDRAQVGAYLACGVDVNGNNHRETPLYWAVTDGDLPMVEYLLAHGARADLATPGGDTPLQRACLIGNERIIKALQAAGATGDPLVLAAATGDRAALERRQAEKPMEVEELKSLAHVAVTARQRAAFDWLWEKLPPMEAGEREKLLNKWYRDAAQWGAAPMMPRLEELGANVPKIGSVALWGAVVWHHQPEAELLLQHGIPATASEEGGLQFLRLAAMNGDVKMMELLLKYGANPNDVDNQGMTPLMWAALMAQGAACDLLIERGAKINPRDKQAKTALWYAAFAGGLPQVVGKLLRHGADPGEKDVRGETILSGMQQFAPPLPGQGGRGYPGMVYNARKAAELKARLARVTTLLLEAGADPNEGDPLAKALSYGHWDIARVLITKGADVCRAKADGSTPLYAAFAGMWGLGVDDATVSMLLDKGAEANAAVTLKDPAQKEPAVVITALDHGPFDVALLEGQPELQESTRRATELLLRHGARFEVPGEARGGELLAAALLGEQERVADLIKAGVSVKASDPAGWTALSLALAMGYSELAGWLIDHGAEVNKGIALRDSIYQFSPLYFALHAGDDVLADRLLAAGAHPDRSALDDAARREDPAMFRRLIAAGGDASQMTDLYPLVSLGRAEALRLALEHGANANSNWNEERRTDVYWAVDFDQIECLKALLDHGANPNVETRYHETPSKLAAKIRPAMVPLLDAAIKRWNESHRPDTEAR
ncbi:hypothetical protein BH09VER1_BH09VER1_45690 [soil metagenome]